MTARRYTVRLFQQNNPRGSTETNLDPADHGMLRRTLEAMVQARTRTLQLDLSRWEIRVHTLGGGRIHATCQVSPAGETVVR